MKNEKSLKMLAKMAKKRLKNKDDFTVTGQNIAQQTEEEQALANKILNVLKSNYDTPAPLMELIDHEKFEALSPLEREIYIFELIDKYNYYKDWYDSKKGLVV